MKHVEKSELSQRAHISGRLHSVEHLQIYSCDSAEEDSTSNKFLVKLISLYSVLIVEIEQKVLLTPYKILCDFISLLIKCFLLKFPVQILINTYKYMLSEYD
jgi:hypothetical protein